MLNRFVRFSVIGFFALAFAGSGVAFAQDDPCDGGDVCEGEDGIEEAVEDGDGAEGDAATGADGDAGDAGGDAATGAGGAYPVAYLARPRVLPAGAWEAGLDLSYINGAEAIIIGSVIPGALSGAGGLSFQYGVMDKLSAGLSYSFALKDFEIKGALNLNAGYLVVHNESMQIRADVMLGYNLLLESLGPVGVGATIQYNLNDKMAVLSSPGFFMDNKLDFGLGEVQPMYIRLPVGFGYQVADNIYAQVDTLLAIIEVSDSETGFIGADFLPLNVTGMYSLDNMIDVGANIGFGDLLENAGDNMYVGVMARYRGGL